MASEILSGAGGSSSENSPNPSPASTLAQSSPGGEASPPPQFSESEKNESVAKNKSTRRHKIRENIRRAGGVIAAKFGMLYKPGRGRPRKDGQPKKSDIQLPGENPELDLGESDNPEIAELDLSAAGAAPVPVERSALDELFSEFVGAAASGSVGGVCKAMKFGGRLAGIPEKEVDYYLSLAAPEPAAMSRLERALKIYVEKTGWKPKNPEFLMLTAAVVEIGAPIVGAGGLMAQRWLEIRRAKIAAAEAREAERARMQERTGQPVVLP